MFSRKGKEKEREKEREEREREEKRRKELDSSVFLSLWGTLGKLDRSLHLSLQSHCHLAVECVDCAFSYLQTERRIGYVWQRCE